MINRYRKGVGGLLMRTKLATFMSALIFLGCCSFPVLAENPSREKCTCDTEADSEPNNGAWVQNATSCWSTEIKERQWCDIVVQSLEGASGEHSIILEMLAGPKDPSAFAAAMEERFSAFVVAVERTATPLDIGRARETVPGLLRANLKVVEECLVGTGNGKRGLRLEGSQGLQCSVGESSGWLRIEFPVGEAKLVYLVAPPS